MSDRDAFRMEWKALERRLMGLERHAPKNALKAASTVGFRVIDGENAKRVASATWITPDHKPAFRRRATKRTGYRYKVHVRRDDLMARSAYAKAKKYPEMAHAFLVERGWRRGFTTVSGRHFRADAFNAKRDAARRKVLNVLQDAIDMAASHPRGYVSTKALEAVHGGAWR